MLLAVRMKMNCCSRSKFAAFVLFDFISFLSVLNCFYESVSLILRKNVEKRALFRHLENIFLALDEIVDEGIVMEIDPHSVFDRLV